MSLSFYMPTKIIEDSECVLKNKDLIKSYGTKALIVTGRHSAKANGSLDDVIKALDENGQSYAIFDKVMANPTIDLVYEGSEFAKDNDVDFIIAIGGGSPMDAAKAISLLTINDIKREELFKGVYPYDPLPMIFIPTTAGTGSEVTQYSILTNDEAETKTTIATPKIFPEVALLDGKYMMSLGKNTTINTALDAYSHAVEGYLSVKANSITKNFSLEAIKIISSLFTKLKDFKLSKEDRDKLLYASTIAGIVIAHTGTIAVHLMGYSLTYYHEIDHGRANGLLLPRFLKFINKTNKDLIDDILKSSNVKDLDELQSVFDGLLGEKEKITLDEIKHYASKAVKVPKIVNCISVPKEDDLVEIMSDVFLK